MSKKVYEIAKELEMESKELLEKINIMGIEAKTHNSMLSDIDATSVENMILHNRKKAAETKIVMAAPNSTGKQSSQDNEVKIDVKHATVATMKTKEKVVSHNAPEQERPTRLATPPVGKPLPKATIAQPPAGIPLPRASSVQPLVGTPLPRSASVQPVHEKKEPLAETEVKPEVKPETASVQEPPKKEIPAEQTAPKVIETHTEIKAETPEHIAEKPKTESETARLEQKPAEQRPAQQRPASSGDSRPSRPQGQGYQGNNPRPQGQGYQGNNPRPQGQGQSTGGYQGNNPRPQGQGQSTGGYQGNNPRPQGQGYQGSNPRPQGQGQSTGGYQGNNPRPQGQGYQGSNPRPQGQGSGQGNRPYTPRDKADVAPVLATKPGAAKPAAHGKGGKNRYQGTL